MFGLGMSEIIFLAILALVVVGPKELPQLARTLGRFLNELKRSSNILTDEIKQHTRLDRLDLESTIRRRDEESTAEVEGSYQTQGPPATGSSEPTQMSFDDQTVNKNTDIDSDEMKKS